MSRGSGLSSSSITSPPSPPAPHSYKTAGSTLNYSHPLSLYLSLPPLPADLDFEAVPHPLVLEKEAPTSNTSHTCTSFVAIDDSSVEAEETFQLTLSSDDPAVVLERSSVTVVIEDNDQVTVGMVKESYEVAEEGRAIEVCARLNGTTEKEIVVAMFTESSTALGKCITMFNNTVLINHRELVNTFTTITITCYCYNYYHSHLFLIHFSFTPPLPPSLPPPANSSPR